MSSQSGKVCSPTGVVPFVYVAILPAPGCRARPAGSAARPAPLARHPHLVAAAGMLAHHLQVATSSALAAAGAATGSVTHPTRPPVPVVVVGRYPLSRLRNRLQLTAKPGRYCLPVRQLAQATHVASQQPYLPRCVAPGLAVPAPRGQHVRQLVQHHVARLRRRQTPESPRSPPNGSASSASQFRDEAHSLSSSRYRALTDPWRNTGHPEPRALTQGSAQSPWPLPTLRRWRRTCRLSSSPGMECAANLQEAARCGICSAPGLYPGCRGAALPP